ncbi:hypothetical protein [Streptomyces sp. NPDC005336]|uniref:hypothetical protein n=1 Tax=Streptomyces sp. NPDC005336 TaxID=3157035 RepID=UPI0033A44BFE
MLGARSQRAANEGELVLTEQEQALLAEIAAMAERVRGELEDVRAEVAQLKEGSSTGPAAT